MISCLLESLVTRVEVSKKPSCGSVVVDGESINGLTYKLFAASALWSLVYNNQKVFFFFAFFFLPLSSSPHLIFDG